MIVQVRIMAVELSVRGQCYVTGDDSRTPQKAKSLR